MSDLVYWIWLSLSCTPDTSTFPNLIAEFKTAKAVYEADERAISKCISFKNSDRAGLLAKNLDRATEICEFCQKHKVGILKYDDENYPKLLKNIKSPPVLLYYRGTLPDFNGKFLVAGVGTRSLSDYGRKNAFKICYELACAGSIIVSGMAMGIDGVALAGAIAGGGTTVAVIGSGIDICYPSQHVTLAREIVKRGCVLTEYAPGTPPNKLNFPKRNRIISGLCSATIVFEGRERSGSLITARYAKEQGRKVYALPASVGTRHSEVSNLLIKNGASLCTRAEDVINDFTDSFAGVINPFLLPKSINANMMETLRALEVVALCDGDDVFMPPKAKKRTPSSSVDNTAHPSEVKPKEESVEIPAEFDKSALKVYKNIPLSGACSIESLVSDTLTLRDVMKALLKLEMNKLIVMLPGEMVSRKSK